MRKKIRYVLGLDIGIASVGWAVLLLDGEDNVCGIVRAGVHTFDEVTVGKEKITATANRRGYRSGRRLVRRKAHRIQRVKSLLQEMNIVSKKDMDEYYSGAVEDVYFLRWAAIQDEPVYILNNRELAQLLIYFAKHRGYKSTAVHEQEDEDDKKVLSAISENKKYMHEHGYRTAGEMIYKDAKFRQKRCGSSEENELLVARNSEGNYSNSISRDLLVEEVRIIFEKQRELGNTLATKELEERFLSIMQSQRNYDEGPGEGSPYGGNLIEKMVGECTFEKGEKRACKASYTSERFVLLEKINHLLICTADGNERPLNEDEKSAVIKLAYKTKVVKYNAIRKELKLDLEERFGGLTYSKVNNGDFKQRILDTEKKSDFISLKYWHEVKDILNLSYKDLTEEQKQLMDSVGKVLTYYKSEEKRREELSDLSLNQAQIEKMLKLNYAKFHNLSFKAMKKLMPEMEAGYSYMESCLRVGYDSLSTDGVKTKYISKELLNEAVDKIMNPTVKRAVRRTVRILNEIVKLYGSPVEIHIEMARDLPHSGEVKKKIATAQKNNNKEKKEAIKFISENFGKTESDIRRKDILRYRLWKNQSQMDLYSEKLIPVEDILDYEKYEVDHIIPYSRSFNDSFNNKVLVKKKDNQDKKNHTPHEYIGHDDEAWNKFVKMVNNYVLSPGKRKNALTKSSDSDEWRSRNLNDTRYTTKVVADLIRRHLVFEPYFNGARNKHVYPLNGGVTARLRHEWGLEKDREKSDKHHAQDAIVIACCTEKMIWKMSNIYKQEELGGVVRKGNKLVDRRTGEILETTALPWKWFREEVEMVMADHPEDYIERAKDRGYMGDIPKPIFVSRLPVKKKTGVISENTIRVVDEASSRTVEKTSLDKLKLIEVNGKKQIKDYYRPEDDVLLYNKLLDRLIRYGNAKDAFAEPFYKPKKDGSDGPIVKKVKLYVGVADDQVKVRGRGEDIDREGVKDRGGMYRCDIFRKDGKYYMVPVYYKDLYLHRMPTKAVVAHKETADWKEMDDKDFLFSLYPDDLIKVQKKNKEIENGYYKTSDRYSAGISYVQHDLGAKSYVRLCIQNLAIFEKLNVDILGNIYSCSKEEREWL